MPSARYIFRIASNVLRYCQGARDEEFEECVLDCDISLVLTTQIGFVAIVEHAPPHKEA